MATSKIVGTPLVVVVLLALLEDSMAGVSPNTQEWIEYDNSFLSITDKRTSTSLNSVQKFWLKVIDGQSVLNQNIVIDTVKQTEKFHIFPSRLVYEAIIYTDFIKNMTVIKIPKKNICFLTKERPIAQPPHQMIKNLQQAGRNATIPVIKTEKSSWRASKNQYNRTLLPPTMQQLCQNVPVYEVAKMTGQPQTRTYQQDDSRSIDRRCSQVCTTVTAVCCSVFVNGSCVKYEYFQFSSCRPVC